MMVIMAVFCAWDVSRSSWLGATSQGCERDHHEFIVTVFRSDCPRSIIACLGTDVLYTQCVHGFFFVHWLSTQGFKYCDCTAALVVGRRSCQGTASQYCAAVKLKTLQQGR